MTDPGSNRSSSTLDDLIDQITIWRVAAILAVVAIVAAVVFGYLRMQEAEAEYEEAIRQVEAIQRLASSDEVYALSREDMAWLEDEFVTLEGRIDRIEELTELPLGAESLLNGLPWISPRYDAAMETLEVGRILAKAGQSIANIGEEALTALDDTGVRAEHGVDRETWLDVLKRREGDLYQALDQMDAAIELRSEIDEAYLPERILYRLRQIDQVIERFSGQRELAQDLPLAFAALGADETERYLVIFQNPSEMRPTGGFVGTVAIVEINRGQILGYDFHDVYHLSSDYQANMEQPINPPWAVSRYIRPDALQFQDANWWPDFPTSAQVLMKMVDEAGWVEVDSVVAVQPETVEKLIDITGPIRIEVDGETREVTSDNLLQEAERQRRLAREGGISETGHKAVIELIGEVLIDHLAQGDRHDMIDAAFLMFEALDHRDMQAYQTDEDVQAFLENRNWAGLLQPESETPTLATAFANITGLKTSLAMQASMDLHLSEPDGTGQREALLTISLENRGDEQGDDFYEGFQRWWVDITLPEGASLIDTNPRSAPDPDASSGGSYIINLDVAEREEISVRFTLPDAERLLIRRQPGLNTVYGTVQQDGCSEALDLWLTRDTVLLFDEVCPSFEPWDDEEL